MAAEPERWLDTRDAAAYLGLTPRRALQANASARVPFEQERPRAKCWFKRNDVDAWRRSEIAAHAAN